MRDLLFTLIMLPTLGSIVFYGAYCGIIAWHIFSLMNPHRFLWGFAAGIPWAQLIAGGTLAIWLLSKSESKRFPPSRTLWLMVMLAIWVTLTTITARNPAMAREYWEQSTKMFLMAAVTIPIMASPQRLRWLVWAPAVAIGFYGIKGGLFSLATGGQYRVQGPDYSFITDNNHMALALVMTIPLLIYLAMTEQRKWLRLGLWASVPLSTIAAVFTYSRGGFLGLVICYALLLMRSRHRFIGGVVACAIALAAIPFLPAQYTDRITSIQTYEQDESALTRLAMWEMALRIGADRPVFGGGFRVFHDPTAYVHYYPETRTIHDVHSAYFQMIGEHGYVGLAIFLALGLSVVFDCFWVVRRTRRVPELQWARLLAGLMVVSLAGFAVSSTFLTLAFYDYLYLEVAIVIALRKVVAEEVRKHAPKRGAQATTAARASGGYWPAPPVPKHQSRGQARPSVEVKAG